MVDYDTILNELGPITQPQWIQLAVLLLPAIIAAMHMTGMMFIGFNQEHVCSMPMKEKITEECNLTWDVQLTERYIPWNKDTESLDSCLRYQITTVNCSYWASNNSATIPTEQCHSWSYDTSVFTTTVVSDFDLVCDNKQQRRLSQAIFMFGVVLGTSIWGQISDRFGRRIAIIMPMVIGVGIGIAAAYAKSILEFTAMRFLLGLTIFPSFSCCYVLAAETVSQKHKVWIGQTLQAVFAIGICILPGLAYYVRYWRTFQLCISVPGVIVILLLWCIFESPRWLISSGKFIKANRIIKKYMRNIKDIQSPEAHKLQVLSDLQSRGRKLRDNEAQFVEEETGLATTPTCKPPKRTILEILRLPNMRKKTLILFYEWMVTSMMYYGLTLNATELGGNPFLAALLSALIEIPSLYLAIPMMQKWGRRPSLTLTLFVSGIACICMMFVSKELTWLNITLSTLGKFAIAATFGVVYIYTADIYPTPVRNVGLGVCSSCARIGGMLAPFIAMLDVVGFAVPYVVFGLIAVLAGFLGLMLPETLGTKLPETLEEAEEFGKDYEGIMALICHKKDSDLLVEEAVPVLEENETKA